jgi:hypothetical protein
MSSVSSRNGPTTQQVPKEFYTWPFPDGPIRIQLAADVIGRLRRIVATSAPANDLQNGSETGGFLLGKVDAETDTVQIWNYRPVPRQSRADRHYTVPGRVEYEKVVEETRQTGDGLQVVGYYRSHLRVGLYLDDEDLAFCQECLSDRLSAFLLVKPQDDGSFSAGFFFSDNGHIHSPFSFLEFPLSVDKLQFEATPNPAVENGDAKAEETPASPVEPDKVLHLIPTAYDIKPEQTEEAGSAEKASWFSWKIGALIGTVVLAIALGVLYLAFWRPVKAPAPVAATAPAPASPFSLQAETRGSDLRVSWDRSAPALSDAVSATITVRDGGLEPQVITLDADQLKAGSLLYRPSSDRVEFRMESNGGQKAKEVVLAMIRGELPKPETQQPQPEQAAQTVPAPAETPQTEQPKAPLRTFVPPKQQSTEDAAHVVYVEPPSVPQSDVNSQLPASGIIPAVSIPTGAPPPPPEVKEAPKPAPVTYSPARPLQRTPLQASSQFLKTWVTSDMQIEVNVLVDTTGKVTEAAVPSTAVGQALRDLVVANVKTWRFEPARKNGQPVVSQTKVTFQLRRPTGSF